MPDATGLFYDYLPPYAAPSEGTGSCTHRWPRIRSHALSGSETGRPSRPMASYLLYVRATGTLAFANELVLARMDGSGERILIPADQFVQIGSPRFSPDGSEIAFIGSLTVGEAILPRLGLSEAAVRSVGAHGPPGDLWLTDLYGSPPRQLTTFEEDEPTLAWSPDGAWLMMLGGGGQYLVRRDGSEATRRFGTGRLRRHRLALRRTQASRRGRSSARHDARLALLRPRRSG